MSWFIDTLKTSVGKKIFMAITGILLLGFLLFHFGGNSTLFYSIDSFAIFVDYLSGLAPAIYFAEFILGLVFLSHITMGIILTLSNWKARNQKYAVSNSRGGQTFASKTMPYTGLILLCFLIIHLMDFTVAKYANGWDGWQLGHEVVTTFTQIGKISFYIIAMIVLGIHISHGFWSLFQSLGIAHIKYTKTLRNIGVVLGVFFAIGFTLIPLIAVSYGK